MCFFFLLFAESKELIIKNVNIPAMVKAGDTDYVILDCDYDLENTSSHGLVVKWFFNGNEVTYQWIYGMSPLAGETASKYADLKYKASDDPYTEYRAIKLDKPGIELTGEYTCVISTFTDERIANATMIVYCKYISSTLGMFFVVCNYIMRKHPLSFPLITPTIDGMDSVLFIFVFYNLLDE